MSEEFSWVKLNGKSFLNLFIIFTLMVSYLLRDDHNWLTLPNLEHQGLWHTGSQLTHPWFGMSGSATQCWWLGSCVSKSTATRLRVSLIELLKHMPVCHWCVTSIRKITICLIFFYWIKDNNLLISWLSRYFSLRSKLLWFFYLLFPTHFPCILFACSYLMLIISCLHFYFLPQTFFSFMCSLTVYV